MKRAGEAHWRALAQPLAHRHDVTVLPAAATTAATATCWRDSRRPLA